MCLVAFSWKQHSNFPLIISANRDEFFDRPTAPLHQWESGILAGKDLRSGGTWMGFHPNGRWSLLTNYRDFRNMGQGQISRGKLVQDFLENSISPEDYLREIQKDQDRYEGFNLLVSDGNSLFYLSNYGKEIKEIEPGIHGLSNGLINDPWPKVELAKRQLEEAINEKIEHGNLLQILKSTETYPIEKLPDTGAPQSLERALSAQLIRTEGNYGTVSSSAVIQNQKGQIEIQERRFQWDYANFTDTKALLQT
ncbi:NRDE family protein [Algoriphagus kandeliae]|uniref:NRDE family protein n=1 Tax=Algoriphagus kandeliae TaxID=2562278 RepID=A0A4Y9QYZ8_9BACT|nr:NRDE family protein [Algoriphagus kandeliae]TFV96305.1 NRDE family protein [Algoriphagus kandeliae]